MNLLLFLVACLLLLQANQLDAESIDNLDLRLVSQLRVELRNIGHLHDQCESFWKGLSDKLGDHHDGTQATRDATLRRLKQRLMGRRFFESLAEFVDKCISEQQQQQPIGANIMADDKLVLLKSKVEELEKEVRNKDEKLLISQALEGKIKNMEAELRRKEKLIELESENSKIHLEQSKKLELQLVQKQEEVDRLRVELGSNSDKLEQMRRAREAAVEKLNELARSLGGHASQLVQEKDFAEQQARELRERLTSSVRDNANRLAEKQEELERVKSKVDQLEAELLSKNRELERARKELDSLKMVAKSNRPEPPREERRFIKVHVY